MNIGICRLPNIDLSKGDNKRVIISADPIMEQEELTTTDSETDEAAELEDAGSSSAEVERKLTLELMRDARRIRDFQSAHNYEEAYLKVGDELLKRLKDERLPDMSMKNLFQEVMLGDPNCPMSESEVTGAIFHLLSETDNLKNSYQKVGAVAVLVACLGPITLNEDSYARHLYELINGTEESVSCLDEASIYLGRWVCWSPGEKLIVSRLANRDLSDELWNVKLRDLFETVHKEVVKSGQRDLQFDELFSIHFAQKLSSSLSKIEPPTDSRMEKESDVYSKIDEELFDLILKDLDEEEAKIEKGTASNEEKDIQTDDPLMPPIFETYHDLAWTNPRDYLFYDFDIDRKFPAPEEREQPKPEEMDSEIRDLMQQAFKEALSIGQRQKLMDEIQKGPQTALKLGVTPEAVPDLVENNPLIAVDILSKLLGSGEDMNEFLKSLIDMDMSVHSMEVINRLTSSVQLPHEFLYDYVSNCIKTCEAMQDKFVQSRLVRLLCVFLQSLIRNQKFDFQILYIDILAFCIEFSRIREAAALYRLMRQIEAEDPELREILSKKLEQHQHLSEEAAKNFALKDKDTKL